MTAPKVGALFAGYGGIELALHDVFGAEPAWFSEFDAAPSRILAHRYLGVPNHGDVTKIKWTPDCPKCGRRTAVYRDFTNEPFYWCARCRGEFDLSIRETDPDGHRIPDPVEIETGGSPCQDVSGAGKRQGMTAGTRSNLWVAMRESIAALRPSLVIWENVRGAYSAKADSDLELSPGLLGDTPHGPVLRALGRVLGDLSSLGYDTAWCRLRAADVGAPHNRMRVFVAAWLPGSTVPHANVTVGGEWGFAAPGQAPRRGARSDSRGRGGAPVTAPLTLLPTPAVNDMGASYTPETWDAWTDKMKAAHGNGNGHGKSLSIEAQRIQRADTFGVYAPAVARWEHVIGRPAPAPTEPTGKDGAYRLSPRFEEWLMGLPDGWVTDVPGITRRDALKALGNGVVPQQCAAAINHLLTIRQLALEGVAA